MIRSRVMSMLAVMLGVVLTTLGTPTSAQAVLYPTDCRTPALCFYSNSNFKFTGDGFHGSILPIGGRGNASLYIDLAFSPRSIINGSSLAVDLYQPLGNNRWRYLCTAAPHKRYANLGVNNDKIRLGKVIYHG